jgi:hypothetical protein
MAPRFENTDSTSRRPDDSAANSSPVCKKDRKNRLAKALQKNLRRRKVAGAYSQKQP